MSSYEEFQYIQEMIEKNQKLTVMIDESGADTNWSIPAYYPEKDNKQLTEILDKRTATRMYSDEAVQLDDLMTILETMNTLDIHNWTEANQLGITINFIIILRNITEVQCPAIYNYNSLTRELELLHEIPIEDEKDNWYTQSEFTESPAVIIAHGAMESALHHFGEHGYRHILTRGGAAVQNAWLTAMTLGYEGCIFAGILPVNLKKYTNIDGHKNIQLCAFSFGRK